MAEPPSSSPRLRRRELGLLAVGACLAALAMHWPLPANLGSDVSRDIGDPLVQAWQVAWGGHALTEQPLDPFQANTFWPLRNSLAFSDALGGYAPAGAVGSGVKAAVVRYNLLFLFAYALCFVGAYLLARELGARPAAAAVAGAAFAYAPWRLEQDGHLHVLSSGGIPVALFLLLRGYRSGRPALVLCGWLVATWQLSLGFTLGLQLAYLLAAGALAAVAVWLRAGRPALRRATVLATVVGALVFSVTSAGLARPYMQVLDDHPEAKRTLAQVQGLSPPAKAFLVAPEQNLVWGKATHGLREELSSVAEQTLFPGVAILTLAVAGLGAGAYPRRWRIGLGAGALLFAVLSLGTHDAGGWLYPYRWLYELAPGWEGIRVPGRLHTFTSLALALLAAAGAQRLMSSAPLARRRGASAAVAALLATAILIEGSGFDLGPRGVTGPSHPTVPTAPAGLEGVAAPQLHLPPTVAANRRFVLWSADGFPEIVNGRASFVPRSFASLALEVESFPDRDSVTRLRALGVRSVVLHPRLAAATRWRSAFRRPVEGLGIERSERGGVVVYELR